MPPPGPLSRTRASGAVLALALMGCNQVLGLDPPETATALRDLVPSRGTLVPAFDPSIRTYRVETSVFAQRLSLTPVTDDGGLQVLIGGDTVPPGTPSAPIALPRGASTIDVDVIEADGVTRYTVEVDRGAIDPVVSRLGSTAPVMTGVFGGFLAADDQRLVVGAAGEDPGVPVDCDGPGAEPLVVPSGAAYVFVRTAAGYVLEQRIPRPNLDVCSAFGQAVAIAGDRLVIGDYLAPVNTSVRAGVAHVYERGDAGWVPVAQLIGPGAPAYGYFGAGVALDDRVVIVGAPGVASGNGDVHVYPVGAWNSPQVLGRHVAQPNANLGWALALDGDRLVVGAHGHAVNGLPLAGSVGVHQRSAAGVWQTPVMLLADTPAAGDQFGRYVALDGDVAVASAPAATSTLGEAHVFGHTGSTWDYRAELTAPSGAAMADLYGQGIAARGDLLVSGWCRGDVATAGWSTDDPVVGGVADAGAALVFDTRTPVPTYVGVMGRPSSLPGALFGCAASLHLDRLFLGAHGEDVDGTPRVGAVYVLE